ncbi:MAG TPA: hypothetical protein VIL46_11345 [Gemmataceae bacterium]
MAREIDPIIRQLVREGKIRLGMTKAEIRELLGPPDQWGNTSRKHREPSIWMYGRTEFWFERIPRRTPWPGPKLVGLYTEDDAGTCQMLLGPSE